MPATSQATGSAHDRGRRLYLRRGNGSTVMKNLALPGGDAP